MGTESEKWSGPFIFVHGADIQLGAIEDYLEKKEHPKWDKEIELTDRTIDKINAMKPKPAFFVVSGDLVNALPGNPDKPKQIADFKKSFERLDKSIRLVCVCGNHDVGSNPTPDAVDSYRKDFGKDFFSFVAGGVLFIVINSQYYESRELVKQYAEEQDRWLDATLEKAKKYKHAIIFQHIPWFLKSVDEPDDKSTHIDTPLRFKMLDKFYKNGICAIFCGHYHQNAGGMYKDMELIVTSAIGAQFGKDQSGVRVVKVLEDAIEHKYYSIDEIPQSVLL